MMATVEVVGSKPDRVGEANVEFLLFHAKGPGRPVDRDCHRLILFTATDRSNLSVDHSRSRQRRPFGKIDALANFHRQSLPQFHRLIVIHILPAISHVSSDRSRFRVTSESVEDTADLEMIAGP